MCCYPHKQGGDWGHMALYPETRALLCYPGKKGGSGVVAALFNLETQALLLTLANRQRRESCSHEFQCLLVSLFYLFSMNNCLYTSQISHAHHSHYTSGGWQGNLISSVLAIIQAPLEGACMLLGRFFGWGCIEAPPLPDHQQILHKCSHTSD